MSETSPAQGRCVPALGSKRINLHLRVPFYTTWGQNLVVSGAGVWALGGMLFESTRVNIYPSE
jgi:hypothetical protein